MLLWNSSLFAVNASSTNTTSLDATNLSMVEGGTFSLSYQVRVIDAARWVTEPVEGVEVQFDEEKEPSFLIGYGLFNPLTLMACFIAVAAVANERRELEDEA
jgi:hypothetical protein